MNKFYVYFTKKTGEIKVVSPVSQTSEYKDLAETKIPHALGLRFITGEESTEKWFVTDVNGIYKLSQNQLDIRPSDQGALIHVPRGEQGEHFVGISATAYLSSGLIDFTIPSKFVGTKLKAIRNKTLKFFLSKRNDPTNLVAEFDVSVSKLMREGSVQLPFESDLKDFSLHTEKVFLNYEFIVRKSTWRKGGLVKGARVNKLVPFKPALHIDPKMSGVVASYEEGNRSIELRLINEPELSTMDDDRYLLIITKHNDPTVVLDAVQFDLKQLVSEEYTVAKLPSDVKFPFGVAGYPMADELAFVKR